MAAAAAVLALGGCAATPRPSGPVAPTIAIETGPCFGFCPVFEATMMPDGTVLFEGRRHTAVLGVRTRAAGRAAYAALARDLAPYRPAAGVASPPSCTVAISDTATVRITWSSPADAASVEHRRGCPDPRGVAIERILAGVPERLGIAAWARQLTRPGAARG